MTVLIDTRHTPIVETTAALGGSATFTAPGRECTLHPKYGVSVLLQRGAANTNVDIIVENSDDNVNFRVVESVNVALTPGMSTATFNRVYDVIRKFMRVRLVNNTANALGATELTTTRKPF